MRTLTICLLAFLLGSCAQPGAVSDSGPSQADRMRRAQETWNDSPWLAAMHRQKVQLGCDGCHRDQALPDDNEAVINGQCVSCHGGYDQLAAVTKAKARNPNINVHASHLGPEIACTVCHQAHRASQAYCVNCHTNFQMPIPGAAPGAVAGK
jgi:hypothetical protein